MADSEWTDKTVAALITLWNEEVPTAEIGRRLGISKNAVIGKVHRLGLPKRRVAVPTKKQQTPDDLIRLENLRPGQCTWPIGDVGDDRFHYCGQQVATGKSYCPKHCDIAHIKPPKVNTLGIIT